MKPQTQTNASAQGACEAMGLVPSGLFIMTASFEDRMAGVLVRMVQFCSPEPPQILVSVLRGQTVEPLIRDSRAFGLCQISDDDRLLQKKFAPTVTVPDAKRCGDEALRDDDPFVSLATHSAPSGSPIIGRALAWLDCELVRNVELEPDHRLYVGRITHGGVLDATRKPAVLFGCNGKT